MNNEVKEKIIKLVQDNNGKITFKEIKRKFHIDTINLQNLLLELKLDGKILQVANKYKIFPDDLLIGDVSKSPSGKMSVFHNGTRYELLGDYFTSFLPNDVVAFRIDKNEKAQVISIIDRRIKNITCEVKIENGVKKIIPFHKGIKIYLSNEDMDSLLDGDIILINKDINNDSNKYYDTLIKKLAIKNSPNKEEIEIAINYGFDNDYSDEYLEELSMLPKNIYGEDLSKRTDYRDLTTVTIDGIYTKDMDDACSAIELKNGIIRVYVHISDVSHYVKPNSLLFERACDKTTSLYLNNTVFHMFHHILSNGICSLNQGEDRLTKTVIMDIDKDGKVIDSKIVKSVINSNKKMTYEDVDKILNGKEIPSGYENYVKDIELLNKAAVRIRYRMQKDGAINFANNELNKIYDNDGNLISYSAMGESKARKLIEYLMIATNEEVAKYLYYSSIPGVFRIHEFPELYKVNIAIANMNALGKRIRPLKTIDSSIDLQKIQNLIENDEDYQILSNILLRVMQRARYSTENLGHFALALDSYTHFTSPIRRLPDLLVHMVLDMLIENNEKLNMIDFVEMKNQLEYLCQKSSFMGRQADMAELGAERISLVKCMEKEIGNEFEAVVLEVGSKIILKINSINITINARDLSSNFKYSKKRKRFYDATNNLPLRYGTKVLVILNGVDLVNHNLRVKVLNVVNHKTLKKIKS